MFNKLESLEFNEININNVNLNDYIYLVQEYPINLSDSYQLLSNTITSSEIFELFKIDKKTSLINAIEELKENIDYFAIGIYSNYFFTAFNDDDSYEYAVKNSEHIINIVRFEKLESCLLINDLMIERCESESMIEILFISYKEVFQKLINDLETFQEVIDQYNNELVKNEINDIVKTLINDNNYNLRGILGYFNRDAKDFLYDYYNELKEYLVKLEFKEKLEHKLNIKAIKIKTVKI